MIKVLEHGIRKITCPYCKAKLQYEQEDIQTDERDFEIVVGNWESQEIEYIICPDCRNEIVLTPVKR